MYEFLGGTLYAVNSGPNAKVQGFVIPLRTKRVSSVFSPGDNGFTQPHDIAVTKNGSQVYVTEIAPPYRLWRFYDPSQPQFTSNNNVKSTAVPMPQPSEPERRVNLVESTSTALPTPSTEDKTKSGNKLMIDEDTFSASVIIMAFLTIPLLLFIGIGALLRLRSNGKFVAALFSFIRIELPLPWNTYKVRLLLVSQGAASGRRSLQNSFLLVLVSRS